MKVLRVEGKYEGIKGIPVIREPGSAKQRARASWRVFKPVWKEELCKKCRLCWLLCPDCAIEWHEGKPHFNYRLCKGCLICKNECPAGAIESKREGE